MTAALTLSLTLNCGRNLKPRIEVPIAGRSRVPEGNGPFLVGRPLVQNYICMPAATAGVAWKFLDRRPRCSSRARRHRSNRSTHFLSASPEEGGTARNVAAFVRQQPVWAADRIYTGPTTSHRCHPVAAAGKVGARPGPTAARSAQTTFIQRLSTSGGIAPATGCTRRPTSGVMVLVPHDRLLLLPNGALNHHESHFND